MSFLDHIKRCNSFDLTQFYPWTVSSQKVGYVHQQLVTKLLSFPETFSLESNELKMSDKLKNIEERSQALDKILKMLRDDAIGGFKLNEKYSVRSSIDQPPLLIIDRGAADLFGILSTGFHLNGIVGDKGNLKMWIATRSTNRGAFPGLLDNMVAGGQPASLTRQENVLKECREEASVDKTLAAKAVPRGSISYNMQVNTTLRRHIMYVYDLTVPPSFQPKPLDGEVEKFELLPIRDVMHLVQTSPNAFKFNCNLVIIDFLVRSGFIGKDNPDYHNIVYGLHSPIV